MNAAFFNNCSYKVLAIDSFFLPKYREGGSRCFSRWFSPMIFLIKVSDGSLSLFITLQASLKYEAVIKPFLRVCHSFFRRLSLSFLQYITHSTLTDGNYIEELVNILLQISIWNVVYFKKGCCFPYERNIF